MFGEECRKRLLSMVFPNLRLLFILSNEAQKLHQSAFCLEVELMVLEDIFPAVWNLQKSSMR